MMNLISEEIEEYCERYSSPESNVLYELNRQTHLRSMMPQMLSGPVQGGFLHLLCRIIKPRRILEIGTFTGYAAIQMAQSLAEDGILYTIDDNEELCEIQKEFIARAGLEERIIRLCGDAKTILPELSEKWDLVFLDADKVSYPFYYQCLMQKMTAGSLILADNVLWSGKVLLPEPEDEDTAALVAFNKMVLEDERVENVLLPIRDGLMMIWIK